MRVQGVSKVIAGGTIADGAILATTVTTARAKAAVVATCDASGASATAAITGSYAMGRALGDGTSGNAMLMLVQPLGIIPAPRRDPRTSPSRHGDLTRMSILLKHADLAAMDKTMKAAFMDAYEGRATPRWTMIASRQSSSSRQNVYPSVIDAASIREWSEGERVVNGLVIEGASVTNQKWELTYGIRRGDLDDDLTGTVAQAVSRVRSGAGKYQRHPDKLIFNVVKNNGTSLDGLALFHATHKVNPKDPGARPTRTPRRAPSRRRTPPRAARR